MTRPRAVANLEPMKNLHLLAAALLAAACAPPPSPMGTGGGGGGSEGGAGGGDACAAMPDAPECQPCYNRPTGYVCWGDARKPVHGECSADDTCEITDWSCDGGQPGDTCEGGVCAGVPGSVVTCCRGCVDSDGRCQDGASEAACGGGGKSCAVCSAFVAPQFTCVNGMCCPPVTTDPDSGLPVGKGCGQ